MAHEINKFKNQDAFAYLREPAWHKLGVRITHDQASDLDAVMDVAGMRSQIEHQEVFLKDGREVPQTKAVIRVEDNQILCTVGADTYPVQNREAFATIEPILKEHGGQIETAGALGTGSKLFMAISMPAGFDVSRDDRQRGYLLVTLDHSNNGGLDCIPTLVRVVCANTMAMAVNQSRNAHIFRIKKTSQVSQRISEAKQLMGRFAQAMDLTKLTIQEMANTAITEDDVKALIDDVFPMPFKKDDLGWTSKTMEARKKRVFQEVYSSPGAQMAGSDPFTGNTTLWGFVNGVSYYTDHIRASEAKSSSMVTKSFQSAMFGQHQAVKLLAMARAKELLRVRA